MAPRPYENSVYCFGDVTFAIVSAVGNLNAFVTGEAEEGFTIDFEGDKGTMQAGAGGDVQHSLRVAQPGTLTLRLLKASSFNKDMSDAYNFQTAGAAVYAMNTVTVTDVARGDIFICTGAAFRKFPTITYATQGGTQEWVFNVSRITPNLGAGVDSLITS